jgi:VanZ family protein
MRKLKHLQLYLALAGAYTAALVWLTLTATPPAGPEFQNSDKWMHLLAYFLLMAWLGQLAVERRLRANLALACMALGALLELLQGLGGVRQMEFADAGANVLGAWLGHWSTRQGGGAVLAALERSGR